MIESGKVLVVIAFLFLPSGACRAGKNPKVTAEALLSQARVEEAFWIHKAEPVVVRAEIDIADAKGNFINGSYAYYWAPLRFREEIRFASYTRIRVGGPKGVWQSRSVDYEPEVISVWQRVPGLIDAFGLATNEAFGKARTIQTAGALEYCTDTKQKSGWDSRRLCFDASTGVLRSIDYFHRTHISRVEYSDFRPTDGKLIPYQTLVLRGQTVLMRVRLTSISSIAQVDPALFQPPANAVFWKTCERRNYQPPKLIHEVVPKYPLGDRKNGKQGIVTFYGIIEPDGSLSHLVIIEHTSPDFDLAAVRALRQWRYQPATCGGKPLRQEVPNITVTFVMRR